MVKKNEPMEDTESLFRRFLNKCEGSEEIAQRQVQQFDYEFNEVLNRISLDLSDEGNQVHSNERLLGDFRILRKIGSGGTAVVFEAEQLSLNRKVAVKILLPHLGYSNRIINKFHREAEAGARQHHPGIVSVYAVGEWKNTHFIAQELVENGKNLAHWLETLKEEKEPPIGYYRKAAQLAADVADALGHAHDSKVIHRDVKPSNILLTPSGAPKVTDFGLAKVGDAMTLSQSKDFAGTPFYMSPEQVTKRRNDVDHRTDIYSLGVTLYEMLTKERPFQGETPHDVLNKIVQDEPKDPQRVNPRTPRDLAVICLKAMEKNPDQRFQTIADFSADLYRFLQGEVIHAKPAGPGARIWKRIKRNPMTSLALGVSILTVLFILVGVPWIIVQKEREKSAAIQAEAQKTKAINDFLERVFSSPDPFKGVKDVKVIEVLDEATLQLKDAFPDSPEVEATLRETIGTTYFNLGSYQKAAQQYEESLDIRRRVLGNNHPDTLQAMNNYCKFLMVEGRYSEAASLFRKMYKVRRQDLGENHLDTFDAINNLALALRLNGDHTEAESLYRHAAKMAPSITKETHPQYHNFLINTASLLWSRDEPKEAEDKFRKLEELYCEAHGEDHPLTLKTMLHISLSLHAQDRYAEVETVIYPAYRTSRHILGEEHPDTINAKFVYAVSLWNQKEFVKCEKLFREILETHKRSLSKDSPKLIRTKWYLAWTLNQQEKHGESASLYREVIEHQTRAYGEESDDTRKSMLELASILSCMKQNAEAENLLKKCIYTAKRKQPSNHLNLILLKLRYGKFLKKLLRYEEAEQQLLSALEIVKAHFGEYHVYMKYIYKRLHNLYQAWGKPDKALVYNRKI